jgi:hypothetical protein
VFGVRKEHCFYFFAIFYLLVCFFSGSDYPRVWPDEVLFFSPAYEFYFYNILRTPVLEGLIPGMSTHTLWMPPLFMYLQSFLFYIFPPDIEVTRMAVSVISVFSVFLFSGVAKEMGLNSTRVLILQAILFSDFLFFKVGHSARMEALCSFFSFGAMYLLLYKKNSGKNVSRIRSALAGLSYGFALISHPFAVAYSPILFLILYFRKQIDKNIFWFVLGSLVPIGIWMSYILPNWDIFVVQFGAQLGRKKELLSVFTIFHKIKIIFSEFKFPWVKILISLGLLLGAFYKAKKTDWKNEFKTQEFPVFAFSILYTLFIFIFLFISSESWYVFHFVFPMALLVVSTSMDGEDSLEMPWILNVAYNVTVLGIFIYLNFFVMDMHNLITGYYRQIESLMENRKKVYLQAIPDPYFYLKKNHPDLQIQEFIPGELPFDPNYYSETIKSNEVYIFYNPDLMNPVLKEYFSKNSELFRIEEIFIQTPRNADFQLRATVYLKK